MNPIQITTEKDRYLISLDKTAFDKRTLVSLIERLRIEFLANQVDFDESIEKLGEDIKQQWWKNNKKKFLDTSK